MAVSQTSIVGGICHRDCGGDDVGADQGKEENEVAIRPLSIDNDDNVNIPSFRGDGDGDGVGVGLGGAQHDDHESDDGDSGGEDTTGGHRHRSPLPLTPPLPAVVFPRELRRSSEPTTTTATAKTTTTRRNDPKSPSRSYSCIYSRHDDSERNGNARTGKSGRGEVASPAEDRRAFFAALKAMRDRDRDRARAQAQASPDAVAAVAILRDGGDEATAVALASAIRDKTKKAGEYDEVDKAEYDEANATAVRSAIAALDLFRKSSSKKKKSKNELVQGRGNEREQDNDKEQEGRKQQQRQGTESRKKKGVTKARKTRCAPSSISYSSHSCSAGDKKAGASVSSDIDLVPFPELNAVLPEPVVITKTKIKLAHSRRGKGGAAVGFGRGVGDAGAGISMNATTREAMIAMRGQRRRSADHVVASSASRRSDSDQNNHRSSSTWGHRSAPLSLESVIEPPGGYVPETVVWWRFQQQSAAGGEEEVEGKMGLRLRSSPPRFADDGIGGGGCKGEKKCVDNDIHTPLTLRDVVASVVAAASKAENKEWGKGKEREGRGGDDDGEEEVNKGENANAPSFLRQRLVGRGEDDTFDDLFVDRNRDHVVENHDKVDWRRIHRPIELYDNGEYFPPFPSLSFYDSDDDNEEEEDDRDVKYCYFCNLHSEAKRKDDRYARHRHESEAEHTVDHDLLLFSDFTQTAARLRQERGIYRDRCRTLRSERNRCAQIAAELKCALEETRLEMERLREELAESTAAAAAAIAASTAANEHDEGKETSEKRSLTSADEHDRCWGEDKEAERADRRRKTATTTTVKTTNEKKERLPKGGVAGNEEFGSAQMGGVVVGGSGGQGGRFVAMLRAELRLAREEARSKSFRLRDAEDEIERLTDLLLQCGREDVDRGRILPGCRRGNIRAGLVVDCDLRSDDGDAIFDGDRRVGSSSSLSNNWNEDGYDDGGNPVRLMEQVLRAKDAALIAAREEAAELRVKLLSTNLGGEERPKKISEDECERTEEIKNDQGELSAVECRLRRKLEKMEKENQKLRAKAA